nr:D214 [uncultured bacterium]
MVTPLFGSCVGGLGTAAMVAGSTAIFILSPCADAAGK